ncbi:MAG TPA: hypothetical protein VHC70_08510 [Phycisphaerales bacterium]|nr:hypothetical protein [Phycisphaerales bacterium]
MDPVATTQQANADPGGSGESSEVRTLTPAQRDELMAWAERAARANKSGDSILCHLVAGGLSLEEGDAMLKAVLGGRSMDFDRAVQTEKVKMTTGRRSAFWPLAVGGAFLTIGLGTWVATSIAAKQAGGVVLVPFGVIVIGVVSLTIGVRRALAKRRR